MYALIIHHCQGDGCFKKGVAEPPNRIPVVVLEECLPPGWSVAGDFDDKRILCPDCRSALTKPFTVDEIRGVITELLGDRMSVPPGRPTIRQERLAATLRQLLPAGG